MVPKVVTAWSLARCGSCCSGPYQRREEEDRQEVVSAGRSGVGVKFVRSAQYREFAALQIPKVTEPHPPDS